MQQQPCDKEIISKLKQLLFDQGVPLPEEIAALETATKEEPPKTAGEAEIEDWRELTKARNGLKKSNDVLA